jgi:hypothetical protein
MPTSEALHISNYADEHIREYAAEAGYDPQSVLEEAVITGISAMRRFYRLKQAATEESVKESLEILGRAGQDNPPDPGDELPEDLKYLLDERRA